MASANDSPALDERQRFRSRCDSHRQHSPCTDLETQDLAVGLIVVDDEHALAGELRLRSLGGGRRDQLSWAAAPMVKWKVEPLPGSLSTHIRPPMSSPRRLLIARPSPVPPYRRVVEASTWLKD